MVVLDFEGTIYDEAALRQDLRKVFNAQGLDFETVSRLTSKHGHFSLDSLEKINIKKRDREKILRQCTKLLDRGEKYVYPDAKAFLENRDFEIGMLSFGDQRYQKQKIEGSGIIDKISKLEITSKDKADCRSMLSGADVYIDDEVEVLKRISRRFKKIFLYFLDRKGGFKNVPPRINRINKLTDIKWRLKN